MEWFFFGFLHIYEWILPLILTVCSLSRRQLRLIKFHYSIGPAAAGRRRLDG